MGLAWIALTALVIGLAAASEEGVVSSYIDTRSWTGTCAKGQTQSPVLLQTEGLPRITNEALMADVSDFGAVSKIKIFNTGMTVEIKWEKWERRPKLDVPAADGDPHAVFGSGQFDPKYFENLKVEPLQFHFHVPGENVLDGKWSAGEIHIVSRVIEGQSRICDRLEAGCLVVYGVLLEHPFGIERANEILVPFLSREVQPRRIGEEFATELDFKFDLNDLFPMNRSYINFPGSLTTPPCTEGIIWMLMREPMQVSLEQIETIQQALALTPGHDCLEPGDTLKGNKLTKEEAEFLLGSIKECPVPRQTRNNRPPQPLNGRVVEMAVI